MPYDIGPVSSVPRGASNLLRLADVLERVKDRKYDHASWGYKTFLCQTHACALGWAGLSGEFDFTVEIQRRSVKFYQAGVEKDPHSVAQEEFEIDFRTSLFLFAGGVFSKRVHERLWRLNEKLGYRRDRLAVIQLLRELADIKIAEAQVAYAV